MSLFPIHTILTAHEDAKPYLEGAQSKFGFVPNLLGVMATAPAALKTYLEVMDTFEKTSFSNTEKQTILLSTSYVNECSYCMAAHTAIGGMVGVADDVLTDLREGNTLADPKLDALAALSRSIVETRGWPTEDTKAAFFKAGYTASQYLDVVVGVTVKTLSNYINHAAETPLDEAFQPTKWAA